MFCIKYDHKWVNYDTQKDHKFADFDKNDGVMCIVIHTFLVILVKKVWSSCFSKFPQFKSEISKQKYFSKELFSKSYISKSPNHDGTRDTIYL